MAKLFNSQIGVLHAKPAARMIKIVLEGRAVVQIGLLDQGIIECKEDDLTGLGFRFL